MLNIINSSNIDMLMISENKLDESFPENQFLLEGYHQPYRLDWDSKDGGILVFMPITFHQNSFLTEIPQLNVSLLSLIWI